MIDLKKYSIENLHDFDLEYKRIDNEKRMTFHYDVYLNNKKLGELHSKSNSERQEISFKSIDDLIAIKGFNYYADLDKAKENIKFQILSIIKFLEQFYHD